MGKANRASSPRMAAAAWKRSVAAKLRVQYRTFQQIADTRVVLSERRLAVRDAKGPDGWEPGAEPLYSSRGRAHDAFMTTLRETRKETRRDALDARDLDLDRLDELGRALWPVAMGNLTAGIGPDVKAHAELRQQMERRARLLGSDAADDPELRALIVDEAMAAKWHADLRGAMGDVGMPPALQGMLLDALNARLTVPTDVR